jgi:protoporphyrinogen oxidase
MDDAEMLRFAVPHIKRMFPKFDESWILDYHVWRATHSQPIVVKRYSELIPDVRTPIEGLYLATMAQVYPEDRGTNYAIREGRAVGRLMGAAIHRDAGAGV